MGDLTPIEIYTGHCRAEKGVPNTVGNREEIMRNFTEAVGSVSFELSFKDKERVL